MADDKPLPKPAVGRARGRARAQPLTPEQIAAIRMPLPPGTPGAARTISQTRASQARVAAARLPSGGRGVSPEVVAGGRGRGVTPENKSRARGVSQERSEPDAGSGRALIRKESSAGSAPSISASGSTPSEHAVEQLAITASSLGLQPSTGSGGNGSGNGSGAASAGRGSTRGRRERADEWLKKTKPDNIDSKQGKSGKAVNITCNFFNVVTKPNFRLYKYRVDMTPEVDFIGARKAAVHQHEAVLPAGMFDGTLYFTDTKLAQDPLVLQSPLREGTVTVTMRLVEEMLPTDYHYMQFFNIVLRRVMEGLDLKLVRRDYFDPGAARELKQFKLEVWPGYVTTIKQHESDLLLQVEISHKILRTDTVLEQIALIATRDRANYRANVNKALLGQIVMTRYNNETYRIDDIDWDRNPTSTFDRRGEQVSLVQYYQEKYNRTIRDGGQPLLVSQPTLRDKRRAAEDPRRAGRECQVRLLVPELCNMTGLSEDQKANFNLMKALGEITRPDPETRVRALQAFSKRIQDNQNAKAVLMKWNLAFKADLANFRARVLDPETILGQGSAKFNYKSDNADWSAAFRNWKQLSAQRLEQWVVLHPKKDGEQVKEFINCLTKVAPSLGMVCAKPKCFELADNRPTTYIKDLKLLLAQKPRIVMVVIPNNKGEHYSAVKKLCCVEQPVPSQVMTSTVLGKPKGLMSVATKVVVQMNCKLGGEPWAVDMPLKDTMVMGYDTYHDSLHKDKSVGALVASINKTFTRFVSSAEFHTNQSEMTDKMTPAISKAIRKYREANNGDLPSRVIMYRDGVGDGQINYVVEHEVAAIEKCFKDSGMAEVKFTYVIVNKRINTRFFTGNGKPGNPHSGTVVDDVVTLPERYDFFLVSQSVKQGTVNPTSYNVVRDTSGLKPEHLQKLTYKLTHLYYNWPGTVRVPAPCQYAHKLALLVGDALHTMPCPEGELDNLLYFL